MFIHRAALHVAYYIATGEEKPAASLGLETPEGVLAFVERLGYRDAFDACKAPDIVAAYKEHGVVYAAELVKTRGTFGPQ